MIRTAAPSSSLVEAEQHLRKKQKLVFEKEEEAAQVDCAKEQKSSDSVQQAELSQNKADADTQPESSNAAQQSEASESETDSVEDKSELSQEESESEDEAFWAEQQARKARYETMQLKIARRKIEIAQMKEILALREERHHEMWWLPRRCAFTDFASLHCMTILISFSLVQQLQAYSHISFLECLNVQQRRAWLIQRLSTGITDPLSV